MERAEYAGNLYLCLVGSTNCRHALLRPDDAERVTAKNYERNLAACHSGLTSCRPELLTPHDAENVMIKPTLPRGNDLPGAQPLSALKPPPAANQPVGGAPQATGALPASAPDGENGGAFSRAPSEQVAIEIRNARLQIEELTLHAANAQNEAGDARKAAAELSREKQALAVALEQERQASRQQLAQRGALVEELATARTEAEELRSRLAEAVAAMQRATVAQTTAENARLMAAAAFDTEKQATDREHARADALETKAAAVEQRARTLEADLMQARAKVDAANEAQQALERGKNDLQSVASRQEKELQREHARAEGLAAELAKARNENEAARLRIAELDARQIAAADARTTIERETQVGPAWRDPQPHAALRDDPRAEELREPVVGAPRETPEAMGSIADPTIQGGVAGEPAREEPRSHNAPASGEAQMQRSPPRTAAGVPGDPPELPKDHDRAHTVLSPIPGDQGRSEPFRPERTAPAKEPSAVLAPTHDTLLKRATEFIRRGDIVGARLILELAMAGGSGEASFRLAETYDPARLKDWNVRGAHGNSAKAKDLYARAYADGIEEARGRIEALQ